MYVAVPGARWDEFLTWLRAGPGPQERELLEGLSAGPVIGIGLLFMFFVMLVVGTTFGMFGGLFGALLFRKGSPPVAPPPIPE